MTLSRTIPYSFSDKHKSYILRCRSAVINIAEGAVRAGKTIDNLFAFAEALDSEENTDRIHLATGSTTSAAKQILGDSAGFGLYHIFRGRCRPGRYLGSDCLYVSTKNGEKTIVFAGGRNADSYKRIRGLTVGLWIATEINLHHPDMIKEAFNRQLAAGMRKIFWDLNPGAPGDFIYRDYIDPLCGPDMPEGYVNYGHFTIFDNPTVSAERLEQIIAQYDRNSVWYRRDIEGRRCAAEGLIYRSFADSPSDFIFALSSETGQSSAPELCSETERSSDTERSSNTELCSVRFGYISVGVDFGGNRSRTTFVASALCYPPERRLPEGTAPYKSSYLPREKHSASLAVLADHAVAGGKGEIDASLVCRELVAFCRSVSRRYRLPVRFVFCDSEAQYLINSVRRAFRESGLPASVCDARKERILSRIACMNTLIAEHRLMLDRSCKLVIDGLSSAVWDDGSTTRRRDDFTSDIDILDALEYSFEQWMGKL